MSTTEATPTADEICSTVIAGWDDLRGRMGTLVTLKADLGRRRSKAMAKHEAARAKWDQGIAESLTDGDVAKLDAAQPVMPPYNTDALNLLISTELNLETERDRLLVDNTQGLIDAVHAAAREILQAVAGLPLAEAPGIDNTDALDRLRVLWLMFWSAHNRVDQAVLDIAALSHSTSDVAVLETARHLDTAQLFPMPTSRQAEQPASAPLGEFERRPYGQEEAEIDASLKRPDQPWPIR